MSFFVRGREQRHRRKAMSFVLFNGYPHGLTTVFSFYDFLFQAMNPDAGVDDLTYKFVLTYEDAAFGVFRTVAGMDADDLPNLRTSS